ncbi:ANTAR domain-containing protein [Streptomyces olivochromogenes]|uniref:ANTAR domain-containing protein n=1 Tax=Streptomyces olivochromogenes TaxID=1963 RepID=UPI001F2633E4|nr:ANTAR domain-containing protein [Streptomyces olivochromogenes]MCF3130656.1 ANTAR domain-containing protein [Streptomyces olivochromogenes]
MPEPPCTDRSARDADVGRARADGCGQAPGPLLIFAHPDGDRVVVSVTGQLGLDDGELLMRSLRDALDNSATGVDLDLSGVDFWDCSALNVLLTARQRALARGKTIVLVAASPVAERLLALTDTYALFTPATPMEASDASATCHQQHESPSEDARDDLRAEVVQLRRALQTRPDIDLARGILMASFGLDPEEAWSVLVTASQNTNTKLHHLARDVVAAVKGAPLPDPVQKNLTAAVAKITAQHDRSGS